MSMGKCKICSKSFSNGRALGGHMRAHFSPLPLPPRNNFQDATNKMGLNESEIESTRNPTRKRSKRGIGVEPNKCKWVGSESPSESTQLSWVFDPSQDEEVALCLMMLSRDVWEKEKLMEDVNVFKCLSCNKVFKTSLALDEHKVCNKQCWQANSHFDNVGQKIFECPLCFKVFGSGRAFGGHKRWHLSLSSTSVVVSNANVDEVGDGTSLFLDLNLPPPAEDDEEEHKLVAVNSILYSMTRGEVE